MAQNPNLDNFVDLGLRSDGRVSNQLRPVACEYRVFSTADGSASYSIGSTIAHAAVYGPQEYTKGGQLTDVFTLNCEYSSACFATNERKAASNDRKGDEVTAALKDILESCIASDVLYGTKVDVYVELVQDDGGSYAACINAMVLALTDAGVPLIDYIIACTATMSPSLVSPMIDICANEKSSYPELTVAIFSQTKEIAAMDLVQCLQPDYLIMTLDAAKQGCLQIMDIFKMMSQSKVLGRNELENYVENYQAALKKTTAKNTSNDQDESEIADTSNPWAKFHLK